MRDRPSLWSNDRCGTDNALRVWTRIRRNGWYSPTTSAIGTASTILRLRSVRDMSSSRTESRTRCSVIDLSRRAGSSFQGDRRRQATRPAEVPPRCRSRRRTMSRPSLARTSDGTRPGREEYGEGQGQGDISTRVSGAALPSCGGGASPTDRARGGSPVTLNRRKLRSAADPWTTETGRMHGLTVRTGFLILSRDVSRQVTLRSVHRERPVRRRPLPCFEDDSVRRSLGRSRSWRLPWPPDVVHLPHRTLRRPRPNLRMPRRSRIALQTRLRLRRSI